MVSQNLFRWSSKERLENLLNAVNKEKKKVQDKVNAQNKRKPVKTEKDW
jgi:hypothetical protein